jgi:hypothetical protein
MPATIAEAAYDLALRAIEQQERRLNELRSRGGTLVAAASIAASVLGAQAVRTGRLELVAALAIVAYVGCVLATLYVLLPHRLVLEFRGSVLFEAARETGATDEEALRTAAEWIEDFHEVNRDELARLGRWYSAAVVAVGVEIVLWTISVGDTLI